jgi:hypothetical protein
MVGIIEGEAPEENQETSIWDKSRRICGRRTIGK